MRVARRGNFCALLFLLFAWHHKALLLTARSYFEAVMSWFNPDRDLSAVCTQIWEADENRLRPGIDYNIDLQGGTRSYKREDSARDPLFYYVNQDVLKKPTFAAFIALLDNYESETGKREVVTREEYEENCQFIRTIMQTRPMQIAYQFLASKKLAPSDHYAFMQMLYDMWFKLYRRTRGTRASDSSGFEHVFVGETRDETDSIIGFHNWIQFYLQEKIGHVDYMGHISKRGRRSQDPHLLTIQFSWKGDVKPVGSTFIGTSPEFEIALYTVCFLATKDDECHVTLDDLDVVVKCHHHGKQLGSCYPQAV